jgi:Na+/phosphate symporter
MRGPLDSKLEAINEELAKMGAEVEEALVRSIEALQKQDVDMAHRVVRNDQIIDDMELIIENHLIQIMATQNPMASDLRRIICISKIITDLERMGITRSTSRRPLSKSIKSLISSRSTTCPRWPISSAPWSGKVSTPSSKWMSIWQRKSP